MNIIDIQDQLKNFSEDQLINEMQMPSGNAPQFLVLSEIQRRKRVRDDFSKRQAAQQQTVAEEAIAAAGVPQSGIAGMSEAMAPKSTMVQNAVGSAMPEAMRSGGLVQFGNDIKRRLDNQEVDPFLDEVEDMAESRFNVDFSGPPNFGMGGARPPGFPSKGGPPTVRPAIARLPDDLEQQFVKTAFDSPTQGGIGSLAVPRRMKDGGVIYAQDGIPRGLRLNNPGNIRPGAGFFGEIGDDGGYAKFDSDAAGIRAIQRLLRTYGNQYGINTLRGLANRYAPPSDNNPTDNYIEFLSQKTGIDPDEPINLAERGADIIPAIIGFEQGQQPFSQDMINKAIGAAQFDEEEDIKSALFPQELIDAGVSPSDLAQADQSPGLMSAMAATSGSSPTPQQDYLAGQLSDGPFDAEGRKRRQAPNRVETDPKGSGGRNDPKREAPDPNRPPVVLEPGDTTKGRNIGRKDARIEDLKAARKRAEDAAKAAEDAAEKEVTEEPTTTDPEPPKDPDAPKTSGLSSIEEEILALQKQMQKDRESDKWLAIAQAGLALMSSNNPTLLGAAGEAGIEGLKAFREANERYQEGVIDLLNARAKLKGKTGDFTVNQMIQRASDLRKMAQDARDAGQESKARQFELAADSLLATSGITGTGSRTISGLADQ